LVQEIVKNRHINNRMIAYSCLKHNFFTHTYFLPESNLYYA
jgi:hypothetical protein